jgi:hypothetical protein
MIICLVFSFFPFHMQGVSTAPLQKVPKPSCAANGASGIYLNGKRIGSFRTILLNPMQVQVLTPVLNIQEAFCIAAAF